MPQCRTTLNVSIGHARQPSPASSTPKSRSPTKPSPKPPPQPPQRRKPTENYSLTLARLKARAEDARETLSSTIDFQKLSANYQAAIAESDAYYNQTNRQC